MSEFGLLSSGGENKSSPDGGEKTAFAHPVYMNMLYNKV
jgi:hypothetical protein